MNTVPERAYSKKINNGLMSKGHGSQPKRLLLVKV